MRMNSKRSELELLQAENRALEMYLHEGKTFREIAQELDYADPSGAERAYKRGLARVQLHKPEELVTETIQRYLAVLNAYAKGTMEGNPRHADIYLRTLKDMVDVVGIGAPTRIEQEVTFKNGPRSLNDEVIKLARVIEYIEGSAADITTLPNESDKGESAEMA